MRQMGVHALLVVGFAALASAQTGDLPAVNFLANSVDTQGRTAYLKGNVRIAACGIVTAESATVTGGNIELGGPVHMQLTNGVGRLKVQ